MAKQSTPQVTTGQLTPHQAIIALAHRRLDELVADAERSRFWGVIGVQLAFENGEAKTLHRRMDGRDKVKPL